MKRKAKVVKKKVEVKKHYENLRVPKELKNVIIPKDPNVNVNPSDMLLQIRYGKKAPAIKHASKR